MPSPFRRLQTFSIHSMVCFLLAVGVTPERPLADRLSTSSSRGLSLIGGVLTLLIDGDDVRGIRRVDKELFADRSSLANSLLARDILTALSWREHHACGRISESIARIATEPLAQSRASEDARIAHSQLRQHAIDTLAVMGKRPNLSSREPPQCVAVAVPILVRYVDEFVAAVGGPLEEAQTKVHETKYGPEWPRFVSEIVARILACHPSTEATRATHALLGLGAEKLGRLDPFMLRTPDCP